MSNNPYIGSSFDELLEEDKTLADANAIAQSRVTAWQIEQAKSEKGLTNEHYELVQSKRPLPLSTNLYFVKREHAAIPAGSLRGKPPRSGVIRRVSVP